MADSPNTERARAALEQAQTPSSLLAALAAALVDLLGASASIISRVIGEMLVDLVEHSPEGSLPGGHGYLISDFPETQRILAENEPATVFVGDEGADAQEVQLLRRLGFEALLMLPIAREGTTWGLVEVYAHDRFTQSDVAVAVPLVAHAADLMPRLET